MSPIILRGTKHEIAASLVSLPGEVSEAIVFVTDPLEPSAQVPATAEELFAEMRPDEVTTDDYVDDSREAIYTRQAGE